MPHRVAFICEQTAREPMLCGCDCGHILWCVILRSIHKSDNPADESPSALLEGNNVLQLDDAPFGGT